MDNRKILLALSQQHTFDTLKNHPQTLPGINKILIEGRLGEDGFIQKLSKNNTDIIIVELTQLSRKIPGMLTEIERRFPNTGIGIITEKITAYDILNALKTGVKGFLSSGNLIYELKEAKRILSNGGIYISPDFAGLFKQFDYETIPIEPERPSDSGKKQDRNSSLLLDQSKRTGYKFRSNDKKKIISEMSSNYNFIKDIAVHLPVSITLYGLSPLRIIWANDYAKKMINHNDEMQDNFIDHDYALSLVHSEDREKLLTPPESWPGDGNYVWETEYRLKGANGEYRHFHSKAIPFSWDINHNVEIIVAVGFDITRLKETQTELNNIKKQLNLELENKKNSLFSFLLYLSDQSNFMKHTANELLNLIKKGKKDMPVKINKIAGDILSWTESNEFWVKIQKEINNEYNSMIARIIEKHPRMSHAELKICAMIRSGLSSKEISSLMNISLRTVETHRQNIRKKLNLKRNDNLNTFLINEFG